MEIYLPNVDMPKGDKVLTIQICPDGSIWQQYRGTVPNAKAVPVPPHGKLIDADALLERFEKEEKAADEHGRDFSFSFKSGGENCTEWWPVQVMLMDAPTIIPADPAEEGNGDVE